MEFLCIIDGGLTWSRTEITEVLGLFLTDIDFVNPSDGWGGRHATGGVVCRCDIRRWPHVGVHGARRRGGAFEGVAGVASGDAWAVGLGIFPVHEPPRTPSGSGSSSASPRNASWIWIARTAS